MPLYEDVTPEKIKARILGRMETDLQTREGSYTNDMIAPVAYELWTWAMVLNELIDAFYVNEYSGPYLEWQAAALAIYRKDGTRARCPVTFTGRDGAQIPAGAVFYSDGGLAFGLLEAVTLQDGVGTGILEALEAGDAGNIRDGEIVRAQRNYAGVESFENGPAEGGTDQESDEALCQRYYERLRRPGTSGNGWHYQQWAMAVEGVGAARVIGKWDGPGTVRVILADSEFNPAAGPIVDAVATKIRVERPVGVEVSVIPAGATEIAVDCAAVLRDDTTPAAVREALETALNGYLDQLARESFGRVLDADWDDQSADVCAVSYNRIAYLLLSIDGVIDFTALTVNGGTTGIDVPAGCVPVPGVVRVT